MARLLTLLLAVGIAEPISATSQAVVSVPNCTFAPPVGVAGCPPFDGIVGAGVESLLDVDYRLIQRSVEDGAAWQAFLPPGTIVIGMHHQHVSLLRIPASQSAVPLDSVPGYLWDGPYLPAYKVAADLDTLVGGGDITYMLDSDGLVRLRAEFHRFEDATPYVAALMAPGVLPGSIDHVEVVEPLTSGLSAAPRYWDLRVPPADASLAVSVLARCEAIRYTETWSFETLSTNEAIWVTQTGVRRDFTGAGYDDAAKLFAHGVTGRGQLVGMLDRGFRPYDQALCSMRNGPNPSDDPAQPSSLGPAQPWSGPPNEYWKPDAKVVAHYSLSPLPPADPRCLPFPQDTLFRNHGRKTAPPLMGDSFLVPAARAGVELDDPLDDEEMLDPQATRAEVGGLCLGGICPRDAATRFIDHHQDGDGLAPGAQLVIQDFNPPPTWERQPPNPPAECRFSFEDVLAQAYDTGAGVRIHNNSWGVVPWLQTPPEPWISYSTTTATFDRVLWYRRDMVACFSAGNQGGGFPWNLQLEANLKNGLSVGATNGSDLGDSIWGGSSCGPGYQHRIKPDISPPTNLSEAACSQAWPAECDEPTFYCGGTALRGTFSSGTSTSAPAASALATLIRQYFVDGYYPAGSPDVQAALTPTGALLRATLINSTRNVTGGSDTGDIHGQVGSRPTFSQGWGKPVLDDTLFFAGDPTLAAVPGSGSRDRSALVVLTDTPNGARDPLLVSDGRAAVVDALKGAIRTGEIHEFPICVSPGEDLHVSLAWADAPAGAASGPLGDDILRNDLDLEVVGPIGGAPGTQKVWRGNPGEDSTADLRRTWTAGYTRLAGGRLCPSICGTTCPSGDLEQDHAQATPLCDFATRDRFNTVENVFVEAANLVNGEYLVRVVGFEVGGNSEVNIPAWPNLNDNDGLPFHDLINDTDQGYALIASGGVATPTGRAHFGRGAYRCADQDLELLVDDCSLVGGSVQITTEAGDCDQLALGPAAAGPAFRLTTGPLTVRDVDDGTAPSTCAGGGDGIIVAPDDSYLIATYVDPGTGRVLRATTRLICRNVDLMSVSLLDGCSGDPTPALRGTGFIDIALKNTTSHDISALTGTLVPFDEDITVVPLTPLPLDIPAGATVVIQFGLRVAFWHTCEALEDTRFRFELAADDGFKDRAYFGIPIDCSDVSRPPEVPSRDDVLSGVTALRASKDSPQFDVVLTWSNVGTDRYNVWRGTLDSLWVGRAYDHAIDVARGECHHLQDLGPVTSFTAVTDGEAHPAGGTAFNYYYLVTSEKNCLVDLLQCATDSPFGFANRDLDFVDDPDERIPPGTILLSGCIGTSGNCP